MRRIVNLCPGFANHGPLISVWPHGSGVQEPALACRNGHTLSESCSLATGYLLGLASGFGIRALGGYLDLVTQALEYEVSDISEYLHAVVTLQPFNDILIAVHHGCVASDAHKSFLLAMQYALPHVLNVLHYEEPSYTPIL